MQQPEMRAAGIRSATGSSDSWIYGALRQEKRKIAERKCINLVLPPKEPQTEPLRSATGQTLLFVPVEEQL